MCIGRYPTGSGARTVVARLPLAPPSGTRRGPPRRASRHPPYHEALPPCAHSRFSSRSLKVPLAARKPRVGSQWDLRSSHWEVAAFPVGRCRLPLWEVTRAVAASAAASKEAPIRPPLSLFAVTQFSRLRCRRVAGLTLPHAARLLAFVMTEALGSRPAGPEHHPRSDQSGHAEQPAICFSSLPLLISPFDLIRAV